MSEAPQIQGWTDPDDFGDTTQTIELPDRKTRAGQPVRVLIQLVPTEVLVPAMEGLPGVSGGAKKPQDFSETIRTIAQWVKPAEAIARAGVLKPEFYFAGEDPRPGAAAWQSLSLGDRAAIVGAVLELSGFGGGGTTEPLRTFPADDGAGGSNGAGSGVAVPDAPEAVGATGAAWTQVGGGAGR